MDSGVRDGVRARIDAVVHERGRRPGHNVAAIATVDGGVVLCPEADLDVECDDTSEGVRIGVDSEATVASDTAVALEEVR